ncbi:hypothetical protein [Pseudenterobacter timonensis]|uniref:Uncharacterized protein n=1 Tax=Pseudenterobacter timonensis TaxID=1755099 RepID=A0ABV4A4H1_9ENTR
MSAYKFGEDDPYIHTDAGAGEWCKTPQQLSSLIYKRAIQMAIESPAIPNLLFGKHSIDHFNYYLNMVGEDYELKDMSKLIESSMVLKDAYAKELLEARKFCEKLSPSKYKIISSKTSNGYFQGERDLYYAIGGFQYWGKGEVYISESKERFYYRLDFELHIFDRYNWDDGKNVLGLLDDHFFGEFHRQCFAREFNIYGIYKTDKKTPISWFSIK